MDRMAVHLLWIEYNAALKYGAASGLSINKNLSMTAFIFRKPAFTAGCNRSVTRG
jgi:hypothetical protein